MAYTTIDQLEKSASGSIINGEGLYYKNHSFVYVEDIKKVLEQDFNGANPGVKNMAFINVVFDRDDDGKNHDVKEITVLAIAKDPIQRDAGGNIQNKEWYDVIGLIWPVYYSPGTVNGLLDERENAGEFKGKPFEGDPAYGPGMEISKE